MIPYEDLVFALQNWRAKQGLPVTGTATSGSGPARTAPPPPPGSSGSGGFAAIPMSSSDSGGYPAPGSGGYPAPGSGGYAAPGSGGYPAPSMEEPIDDVDDALVEEAHLEPEAGDFAMELGGAARLDDGESTSIGGIPDAAPEAGAEDASESGRLRGTPDRNEDW